jgi:hypothetical protein
MKGDFTRDTFDRNRHFSRVLLQQGRVQLDADFNEQTAILLHRQHALAADLIGPHGAAPDSDAFMITDVSATDFKIGNGRFYVEGILCENDERDEAGNYLEVTYKTQPAYHRDEDEELPAAPLLVYLDVWERHLTYVELEDADGSTISIRESALKGPDTATRAQVVWQVKIADVLADGKTRIPENITCEDFQKDHWAALVQAWQPAQRGRLKVSAVQTRPPSEEDPCITPPESRYRGAENQLYRVEIHDSGPAGTATFKWSRDNGQDIFPILEMAEKTVTLEHLGRDGHSSLQVNDWVEVVDDDYTLTNGAEPLLQVTLIDPDTNIVTLSGVPALVADPARHRLLRRWDQRNANEGGVIPVVEKNTADDWIELENGIQIQFQPTPAGGLAHQYRTGDYWLIPARTVTGDVEWPGTVGNPKALPPHGVEHHYAPLAIFPVAGDLLDCRRKITNVITNQSDLQVHNLDVGGTLTVDGNVGLGTTEPDGRLTLQGIVQPAQGSLTFFSNSADMEYDGGNDKLFIFRDKQAGATAFMGGWVGIGTTSPRGMLEVAGDAFKSGGGSWTTSSDIQLKKNVKTLEGALTALLQLRGVNFEWKQPEQQGNLAGQQMGFVAQEVESVFPSWVGTNQDGTKNLTIRGFEALAVEAVRELNRKVDELSRRLEAIEQQLGLAAAKADISPSEAASEKEAESEAERKDETKSIRKKTGKKTVD